MLADVNIIAGCTARKTTQAVPDLQLRKIKTADTVTRAQRWIERLRGSKAPKLRAGDLYAGDAWQTVKAFRDRHHLWVASAGYGLVRERTAVCSYSATFSKRDEDSVVRGRCSETLDRRTVVWWHELGKWEKTNEGRFTITTLARREPNRAILVILSPEYLKALEDDLCFARSLLLDPTSLVIVSAGASKTGALSDNFVPCDARLQSLVGGGRNSLNARLARKILTETDRGRFNVPELRKRFNRLLKKASDLVTCKRTQINDGEVTAYIIRHLQIDTGASYTCLLRTFRGDNYACEEKRFRKLFWKVQCVAPPLK